MEFMKKFWPAVCVKCAKGKVLQRVSFHLDHNPERLTFRCFTCGAEEIFYFELVTEKTKEETIRRNLKVGSS